MSIVRLRRGAALLAVPSLLTAGLVAVAPTPALAATPDPAPGESGAAWLKTQLVDGLMPSPFGGSDVGLTIDTVLALRAIDADDADVASIRDDVAASSAFDFYVGDYSYTSPDPFPDGPEATFAGHSSNATAKAAAFAVATGADPTAFGGHDLVAALSGMVVDSGAAAGRLTDEPTKNGDPYPAGDYASTIGQSFAAAALDAEGSTLTSPVTEFLLAQQCADGFFRASFSAIDAPVQSCPAGGSASTDATALAILNLQGQTDDTDVQAAIDDAVAWLTSAQAGDGSFGSDGQITTANANSTGLAAWALGVEGETAAAEKAAVWLRSHQLVNAAGCTPYTPADEGAIAYDDAGLDTAAAGSIDDVRDQFRRATAQGLPGLRWAPQGVAVRGDVVRPVRAGRQHPEDPGRGVAGRPGLRRQERLRPLHPRRLRRPRRPRRHDAQGHDDGDLPGAGRRRVSRDRAVPGAGRHEARGHRSRPCRARHVRRPQGLRARPRREGRLQARRHQARHRRRRRQGSRAAAGQGHRPARSAPRAGDGRVRRHPSRHRLDHAHALIRVMTIWSSRSLAAPAGAAAGLAVVVASLVGPGAAPARAEACSTATGVTVVVDFNGLGGGVQGACLADGGGEKASVLFEEGGFALTYAQREPGFVCRVAGVPTSDPCVNTSPANAYWGLWWSDGKNGRWTYSSLGAASLRIPDGGYAAFSWDDVEGSAEPSYAPAPHPTQTPTPSPSTSPSPSSAPSSQAPSPSVDPGGPGPGGGASSDGPGEPGTSGSPDGSPSGTPGGSPGASPSGTPSASTSASTGASTSASPSTGPSGSPSRTPSEGSSPQVTPSGSPTDDVVAELADPGDVDPSSSEAVDAGGDGLPVWVVPVVLVLLLSAGAAAFGVRQRRSASGGP